MYSCGSSAPRNFKKFADGGGCMNCTVHGKIQPWEQGEGAVHVLVDMFQIGCGGGSPGAKAAADGEEKKRMRFRALLAERGGVQEAGSALFCVSQEKLHTVVLKGVGSVPGTL